MIEALRWNYPSNGHNNIEISANCEVYRCCRIHAEPLNAVCRAISDTICTLAIHNSIPPVVEKVFELISLRQVIDTNININ